MPGHLKRTLHSSTVLTRKLLVNDYLDNQTHADWYAMLYGALRDEIDHEDCHYTNEELFLLAEAAEILEKQHIG